MNSRHLGLFPKCQKIKKEKVWIIFEFPYQEHVSLGCLEDTFSENLRKISMIEALNVTFSFAVCENWALSMRISYDLSQLAITCSKLIAETLE